MQAHPGTGRAIDRRETAVDLALADDWEGAHRIVQALSDPIACWIHSILHKIEGDEWNSRYWYGRSDGRRYEDVSDPRTELEAVRALIRCR